MQISLSVFFVRLNKESGGGQMARTCHFRNLRVRQIQTEFCQIVLLVSSTYYFCARHLCLRMHACIPQIWREHICTST